MNRQQRERVTQAVEEILDGIDDAECICCPNCFHFVEASETCLLATARPPARVIAFGCPSFKNDLNTAAPKTAQLAPSSKSPQNKNSDPNWDDDIPF